jgi:excisionase family DNA binding protein
MQTDAASPERSTRLLTTEEAAALLGAKPQTLSIWRCTRVRNIPFVKIGRLVRYRERDLIAWLEKNTIRGDR